MPYTYTKGRDVNQPIVVGGRYIYRSHTLTHLVLSAVPSVLAESQSDSFPAERAVCSWTAKGTQFKLPPTYTPQFQYFNHVSGCSVQCANRARNTETTVAPLKEDPNQSHSEAWDSSNNVEQTQYFLRT